MERPTRSATFGSLFVRQLEELLVWRRDVRRFRSDPIPPGEMDELLRLACLAPSVGNAQPWRFVRVKSENARKVVRASFEQCNQKALAGFEGARAKAYAELKLSGLDQAPLQLAVFCEEATSQGHGLGRATMPETLAWSVVGAIHLLWLSARVHGLGLGWVSILDPVEVTRALDVPPSWKLIAYLCLGWPEDIHDVPELERLHWQARTTEGRIVLDR